jgi:hypothetical protein
MSNSESLCDWLLDNNYYGIEKEDGAIITISEITNEYLELLQSYNDYDNDDDDDKPILTSNDQIGILEMDGGEQYPMFPVISDNPRPIYDFFLTQPFEKIIFSDNSMTGFIVNGRVMMFITSEFD